jgi:hypothetical protein
VSIDTYKFLEFMDGRKKQWIAINGGTSLRRLRPVLGCRTM